MILIVFFSSSFFYCCSSTLVSIFWPSLSSSPPTPTSHHQSYRPLALSMGPRHMFLGDPSPSSPCYPPPPSPLVTISLFFISMSLVIFWLLVCIVVYVPLIGEIMWYLSFTSWLISLSILLSSSIHAVAKARSSFFLLHSIPLCKCTTVFWSTHMLMGT